MLWKEYRGRLLELSQVRQLLQLRVLLRPLAFEGAGAVLLQLTEAGAVLEIPVPQAEARRAGGAGKPRPAARRKGGKPPRRTPTVGETPNATPGTRETGARPRKSAARKTEGPLGTCPLCKSDVVEQDRSYGCSSWRAGCKFAIWKTMAGKEAQCPHGPLPPAQRQEPAPERLYLVRA